MIDSNTLWGISITVLETCENRLFERLFERWFLTVIANELLPMVFKEFDADISRKECWEFSQRDSLETSFFNHFQWDS